MSMYEQIHRDCLFEGVALYELNGTVHVDGEPSHALLRRIRGAGRGLAQYLALQQTLAMEKDLPPPRREQGEVHPLSPYQQGFYAESLERGTGAPGLIQTGVFDLPFTPSRQDVETVFNALLAEHAILRAVFFTAPGEGGLWKSAAPFPQKVEYHVCRTLEDFEETLEAVARRYNAYAPVLEKEQLLKLAVVASGSGKSGLVIAFHHIIMDGWSMSLFLEAFMQGLESLRISGTVKLPRPSFDYAGYSHWVNTTFLPVVKGRQLAYWRNKLAFAPFAPSQPTDFPRRSLAALQAQEPKRSSIVVLKKELPGGDLAALQNWTSTLGCTAFCALHTALRLALCLSGGDRDEPILTISANRAQTEDVDEVIGAFVNVVPLFSPLKPEEKVESAVRESHACLQEALANQDLPFFLVAEGVSIRHTRDWHPVGRTLLLLQNMHGIEGEFGALPRMPQFSYTEYELAFLVWDYGRRGAVVTLEYDESLYAETTARMLLDTFIRLCGQLPQIAGIPVRNVLGMDAAKVVDFQGGEAWLAKVLFDGDITRVCVMDRAALGADILVRAAVLAGRELVEDHGNPERHCLIVASDWEQARSFLGNGHSVCLLNHLPTAALLRRNVSLLERCWIALSADDENFLAVIHPNELQKLAFDARYIAARIPDQPSAERSHVGTSPLPGYWEASFSGSGWARVLLPCASARMIWRNGQAFDLEQMAQKYFGPGKAALSLVAPQGEDDSLLRLDGEMTIWVEADEQEFGTVIQNLPEPLRPIHKVRLTQLPLRRDGNIDRRMLEFLPLVSEDLASKAASGRNWRMTLSRHCSEALKKLTAAYAWKRLFSGEYPGIENLPAPGLLFTQNDLFLSPAGPPHAPFAAWDAPFPKGGRCIILNRAGQAGEDLMEELAGIFCETDFWMLGGDSAARENSRLLALDWDTDEIIQKFTPKETTSRPGAFFHLFNAETAVKWAPDAVLLGRLGEMQPHSFSLTVLFGDQAPLLSEQESPWGKLLSSDRQRAGRQSRQTFPEPFSRLSLLFPPAKTLGELAGGKAAAWVLAALQSGAENLLAGLDPEHAVSQGLLQGYCFAKNHIEIEDSAADGLFPYPLACAGHPVGAGFTRPEEHACEATARPDADSIKSRVERIWLEVLEINHVLPDTNFFDLGGSSVLAPVMRDALSRALGVDIGAAGVFKYSCLREMQEAVLRLLEDRPVAGQFPTARATEPEERRQKRVSRRQARRAQLGKRRMPSGREIQS